jgi:hypothetical protein
MENLPGYVSITFVLTTFLTVGFLFYAIRQTVFKTKTAKILIFLVPVWLIFQAVLALSEFYLPTDSLPPRLFSVAILPALLLFFLLFVFERNVFVSRISLKTLTLLHIVRIPVEIVLLWLYQSGQVPRLMTFEGRNFDVLSGLTAPVVFWLAFSNGKTNRAVLIVWNIFALLLLINIVINAVLSIPSQLQKFAFDQPNIAVLHFPFIWLPAVVVPIVLFSHLASLWQLATNDKIKTL